jgi:uncharacterized protein
MANHPAFEIVEGTVLHDQIIPPGEPWARVFEKDEILRIVDLEGQQAVDFLCYNAQNPAERYNAADTMKFQRSLFIGKGTALYSDLGNKLFTVIADTCGRHDTIAGCCSAESNFVRYGVKGTPNCRDNFLKILPELNLGKKDIVANVNFFMYVPVALDGAMGIADGVSAPGSYVDLKAEMAALAVISNCPQTHNPAAGYKPTPVRVMVWRQA